MDYFTINYFVASGFFVLGMCFVLFVSWLCDKLDRVHAKKESKERIKDENQHKLDMIYKFAMHHACMYEDKDNQ